MQRLKAEVEKALTMHSQQESDLNENKVDSIIYKVDDNTTKTIYTYDKEGNLITETEYFKSATSNDYIQSSSVYYGPGGDCPAYTIITQNDADNALRTRYEYDWTTYAPISDEVNPSPWDHCTLVQEEENGQWKTTQTCTPEFKDGRLMSLTYAELNSDNALGKTYRVAYHYDSEGKLVKIDYEDYTKEEAMSYDIKYTDEGKLLRYGFENGTWYAQYEYNDDNSYTYTEHNCSDGNDVIDYSLKQDYLRDTSHDVEDGQLWTRTAEWSYDDQGNKVSAEVSMSSVSEDHLYYIVYASDSTGTIHNMVGATITYNGDDANVVYYTYDENENKHDWSSYSVVTDYLDTYTKREAFYDESGFVYSDIYTYYHNPDISAVQTVTNTPSDALQNIYDLSGRITHQKRGIIIVNGKKKIIRAQH